jgi:hypothetical protein
MAVFDSRITELFAGSGYGARRRGDYTQAELDATAQRLGLWGDVWGDEGRYTGITDRQAVFRELEKQDYERYVPQDLRDALNRGSTLKGYGVGDRAVDQFGNPLSGFSVGSWEDDGHVFNGSNYNLPTSVADLYPQLGAQWVQKPTYSNNLLDKVMPMAATAFATAGFGSGISSYLGSGLGGVDPNWADAFSNWGGTDIPLGGSDMSFFPDILGDGDWSSAFNGWGGTDVPVLENLTSGSGMFPPAIQDPIVQEAIKAGAMTETAPGVWELTQPWKLPPETSLWDTIINKGGDLAKSIFGGGGGNASGGGTSLNLGRFLPGGGDGESSLLGSALSAAPVLAAINYARNQSPFDTSRLTSAYDRIDPNALTFQYDQNTGLGREALVIDLNRRGVTGSSFGDQSVTSYNTNRELGRNALLTTGATASADIAGKILNAQVQERQLKNQLYGSALNALGNIFSPRPRYGF